MSTTLDSKTPESPSYLAARVSIVILLMISAAAMVWGHILIQGQPTPLGTPNGGTYAPHFHVVSQYIANPQYGMWVKGGLAAFVVALILFFRTMLRARADVFDAPSRKFLALVLGAGIVIGLVLVAIYDFSPVITRDQTLLEWLLRKAPQPDPTRVDINNTHTWGFMIFAASFFMLVIWVTWLEYKFCKNGRSLANSIFVVLLLLVFGVWLFFFSAGRLPGIPQRAFLLTVYYWVFHNFWLLKAKAEG